MKITFTKLFCLICLILSINIAHAQDVIWGDQPGQGDFDGGLNDWTLEAQSDTTLWLWTLEGDVSAGAFAAPGTAIDSPTAANGSMMVNGDFLISGGDQNNIPNPTPTIVTHLISPVIDISASNQTALSVKFSQLIRRFVVPAGTFYSAFSVSTDGGSTWSDPIDCNSTLEAATANNPIPALNSTESVGIPFDLTQNQTSMQIRFTYSGDFYFWVLDDIQIVSLEANNMQVNNFIAIAPNWVTPVSQVHPFGFLADVENVGSAAQTNVELTAKIFDPSGAEIYSETKNYGTIDADSLAQNDAMIGEFTPPAVSGEYTGTYSISADSMDFDESNNGQEFSFVIGDTTFQKEDGIAFTTRPADGSPNWAGGVPHSWAYGNYFYVPNGAGWEAAHVSFGMGLGDGDNPAAITGESVVIWLYEWDDMNDDGDSQMEERTAVGFQSYEIVGTEVEGEFLRLPLENFTDASMPIALKDDTDYLVAVTFASPGDDVNLEIGMSGALDYGGMVIRADSVGAPRYAGMLSVGDDGIYNSVGFGYDFVPAVRLHITEEVLISTQNLLSSENKIEIYPNPIDELMNVNFQFTEQMENVKFKLLDVQGKTLAERSLNNTTEGSETFNVDHLSAGTYILQVITNDGIRSIKALIQR